MKKITLLGIIILWNFSLLLAQDISGFDLLNPDTKSTEIDLNTQNLVHDKKSRITGDSSEYNRFLSEILSKLSDPSPQIRLSDDGQCSADELLLDTQAKIDAFNCSSFVGTIVIKGSGITNIDSLSCLTSVDGNLMVYLTSLTDLSGLSNLQFVTERFGIDNNKILTSLDGLSSLSRIEQGLYIYNCPQLASIEGLSGLSYLRSMTIHNIPQLQNLRGLSNISEVTGTIALENNSGLTSLEGFPPVTSIGGSLYIDYNHLLTNLDELSSLQKLGIHLFIIDNRNLNNIDGISNLRDVGQFLFIYSNPQLTECQQICPLLQNYYATHPPDEYFRADIENNGFGCSESEIKNYCGFDDCSGYIVFENQQDINDFKCKTFNGSIRIMNTKQIENIDSLHILTSIIGSIEILNTSLTNLNGFSGLKSVGKYITIRDNTLLQNIKGLNQLDSIGENLLIKNNIQLTSLNGISGIKSIGNDLSVFNNYNLNLCCDAYPLLVFNVVKGNLDFHNNGSDCYVNNILNCPVDYCYGNLILDKQHQIDIFNCTSYDGSITISGEDITNLNGLLMLDSIKGSLKIYSTRLQNLNGLENLTYINGNLGIDNNDQLTSLNGLAGLSSVKSSIFINNNNLLDSLDGLSSLTSLPYGGFKIYNNDNLKNLTGLEGLSVIGKGLDIEYNDNLESLEGLSLNQVGSLKITDNPVLDDCCVLHPLVSSGDIPGDVQIENNSGNCSESGILVNCINCKGYLVLDSQEKADAFNCPVFRGDIRITGQDITNLDGLSVLDSLIGSLHIVNTSLQNLDGLSELSFVGKDLGIHENNSLTDIDGLSELENVQRSVFINNSKKLANLNGLSNLRSIGKDLKINKNDLLTDLNGLSELVSVGQDVIITHNINLETLEGLHLLSSIGNNLIISGNLVLKNLNGIPNITVINGMLQIESNKVLNDLSGFSNITHVGDLEIIANHGLRNLDGLSGLTSVETLGLISNVSLQNITGLSALTTISNTLYVHHTYQLQSLDGLPHLDSINNIIIYYNTQLSDISAISGLKKIKGNMIVNQNPLKTLDAFSEVQWVGGNIDIYGNEISNVDDLGSLKYVGGDLTILNVPETNYCGIYDLLRSNNIGGEITLNGNIEDILNHCALSTCSGTITLDTQEKVDVFDCTSFEGSVRIAGEDITNVDALSNLEYISMDLTIKNTSIEYLSLSNLNYVGNELKINENNILKNLDGLSALTIAGSCFFVFENNSLEQINGLTNLKETYYLSIYKNAALSNIDGISGLNEIEQIHIYGNSNLISIQGLEYIHNKSVDIIIEKNPLLTECCILNYLLNTQNDESYIAAFDNGPGCSSEEEILTICNEGNSCYGSIILNSQIEIDTFNCTSYLGSITITGEDITNLNGLSGLQTVEGNLIINHTSLSTLDGLDSLKYIGLDLEMKYNLQLTNTDGLTNLSSIGKDLYLEGNSLLTSLKSFTNLSDIGKLILYNNNQLYDLDGLEGITSLDLLGIYGNDNLVNLEGLSNLENADIIYLYFNPSLSDCCALYPVLSSGLTSQLDFYYNGSGCTPEEILTNCKNTSARSDDNKGHNQNDQLAVSGLEYQIYPNPLNKDILSFDLESGSDCDMEIRICNLQGNIVYNNKLAVKKGQNTLQLDLSHVTKGAYILYFKNNEKTNYVKLIKSN